jgi:SAM-dependent methyltransferase
VVVDFGSGGGTLLYNIAKNTEAILVGMEQADHAIAQSLALVPRMRAVKSDILNNSLKNESIDFAFSTMVIEHIDDEKFTSEIYRVLKPGGYFLVTSVLKSPNAWYFYKNAAGETVLEPTHLREYKSLMEFENLVQAHGFSIIKSKTPSIKFPLLDPFIKMLVRVFNFKNLMTYKPIEAIRLATQIPIPGYYAVEVLAQKT